MSGVGLVVTDKIEGARKIILGMALRVTGVGSTPPSNLGVSPRVGRGADLQVAPPFLALEAFINVRVPWAGVGPDWIP